MGAGGAGWLISYFMFSSVQLAVPQRICAVFRVLRSYETRSLAIAKHHRTIRHSQYISEQENTHRRRSSNKVKLVLVYVYTQGAAVGQ